MYCIYKISNKFQQEKVWAVWQLPLCFQKKFFFLNYTVQNTENYIELLYDETNNLWQLIVHLYPKLVVETYKNIHICFKKTMYSSKAKETHLVLNCRHFPVQHICQVWSSS